MPNKMNVSAAKPSINGCLHIAPVGTTLPTSAVAELNQAFKSTGYLSTDGVVNKFSRNSTGVNAWGGDNVLDLSSEITDTINVKFMEVTNVDVLKLVYGDSNVEGSLETGITIKANDKELEEKAMVLDMIMRDGALKRLVYPKAKLTDLGDITYKEDGTIQYDATISGYKGADGDSHKEYIVKPTVTPQQEEEGE